MISIRRRAGFACAVGFLLAGPPQTLAGDTHTARIGIIVDDIGYNRGLGMRALALPGPLSYSFLPDTPYAAELAERAHLLGKQVLLHLPMQGHDRRVEEPESLTRELDRAEFKRVVKQHFDAIPYAAGANNHMGSRLTPLDPQMDWLMEEVAGRRWFFIDSRTTPLTVIPQRAAEHGVAFSQRDVFLDNRKDPEYIRRAFAHLVDLARERGGAIAIAHPYPVTLDVLSELLPELSNSGIELVNVSALLDQGARRRPEHLVQAEDLTGD